jgi:hypothetical protein
MAEVKHFAHVDENGFIVGWYHTDLFDIEAIPQPNIELTEDQWQVALNSGHNKIDQGQTVFADQRTEDEKAQYKSDLAKQTLASCISAPLSLSGAEYQMTDSSIANIERAIRIAERESLPDSTVRKWRLADNTWRDTTLAEIKKLQIDYDNRFQAVWQAYNLWTEGDQAEDFNYEH